MVVLVVVVLVVLLVVVLVVVLSCACVKACQKTQSLRDPSSQLREGRVKQNKNMRFV